ncbi:MAG: hypothetical protein HQ557_01265 [Bacteroidetes bacterium]|nr:hypothetical protein [Bacteroidota bacterium]
MLNDKNRMLIKEHMNYIETESTRNAYSMMLGATASMLSLKCYPQNTGVLKDFRFYTDNDEQPFAFIVNKKSLLFYIRLPAVRAKIYNFKSLQKNFHEMSEKPTGEWKIRIETPEDALKVIQHILTKWQEKYC